MKVLYLTSFVLGDSGANAADIFPRLSVAAPRIDRVYVADFPKNKHHIQARQGAEYLRLEWNRTWIRHAARIARKCRQDDIDVIHIFYRQQNAVILILIRICLWLLRCRTQIIMDHRSVNLARGWRGRRKKALNLLMQLAVHALAGNPWAVETNHFFVFRPKHLIDLGYDDLPDGATELTVPEGPVNIWFIGSLKPGNRKSRFLLDVFDRVAARLKQDATVPDIALRVAGPAREDQIATLRDNPNVTYYGKVPRQDLYALLRDHPGIGLAYMNHEFHEYAPSLKFAEYAIMRFGILSSDTVGLQTQADRMNLPSPVTFLPEHADAWADAIITAAKTYTGPEPFWQEADRWSYPAIYRRQVLGLYELLGKTKGKAGADALVSQ